MNYEFLLMLFYYAWRFLIAFIIEIYKLIACGLNLSFSLWWCKKKILLATIEIHSQRQLAVMCVNQKVKVECVKKAHINQRHDFTSVICIKFVFEAHTALTKWEIIKHLFMDILVSFTILFILRGMSWNYSTLWSPRSASFYDLKVN